MPTTITNAETVTCLVCGHAVTGAVLSSGPYHDRCAARLRQVASLLVSAGLGQDQAERALQALIDGAVIPAGTEGTFLVVASEGDGSYVSGANFCSCPAAAHCYHIIAVILLVAASHHP